MQTLVIGFVTISSILVLAEQYLGIIGIKYLLNKSHTLVVVKVVLKKRRYLIVLDMKKLIVPQYTEYDIFICNGRQIGCDNRLVFYDNSIVIRLCINYGFYFFLCRFRQIYFGNFIGWSRILDYLCRENRLHIGRYIYAGILIFCCFFGLFFNLFNRVFKVLLTNTERIFYEKNYLCLLSFGILVRFVLSEII